MQTIFAPDLFQRMRNPKLKEHDAYSLFRWPFGAHFPFAFSPSAFLELASPMPKLVARLRIPAAVRFSRTAIAAEFSPDAARARNRSSSLEVQVERLPIISLPSARVQPRRAVLSNPKLRASEIFPTRALPEKPSLIKPSSYRDRISVQPAWA